MCDNCKEELQGLKKRNQFLEELFYNTKRNSGKTGSITNEIKEINERDDELVALRQEFRNLIQINSDLRKNKQEDVCCCSLM